MFIVVVVYFERDINIKWKLKVGLFGYDYVYLKCYSVEIEVGRLGI